MPRILVVDDEPINRMIIANCLADNNCQLDEAEDGEDGWQQLQRHPYDLIVLDRVMPRLDGLSLLKRIKADARWRHLPVIMQTAASQPQEVLDGIEAGAYHYLTKPYEPQALRTLVTTVLTEFTEKHHLQVASDDLRATFVQLESATLRFRSLAEARSIAATLASLCADPASANIGLIEMLVNAVEHGNLGITYAEKAQLRRDGAWEAEIDRRLQQGPWATRSATLALRREDDEFVFTLTDAGDGFDWSLYLEFSPERAFDLNGRGIAMAKMVGLGSLEYRGKGNIADFRIRARA